MNGSSDFMDLIPGFSSNYLENLVSDGSGRRMKHYADGVSGRFANTFRSTYLKTLRLPKDISLFQSAKARLIMLMMYSA